MSCPGTQNNDPGSARTQTAFDPESNALTIRGGLSHPTCWSLPLGRELREGWRVQGEMGQELRVEKSFEEYVL